MYGIFHIYSIQMWCREKYSIKVNICWALSLFAAYFHGELCHEDWGWKFSRNVYNVGKQLIKYTLPRTNSSPLKMDGWKMIHLPSGWPIFRANDVSFKECRSLFCDSIPDQTWSNKSSRCNKIIQLQSVSCWFRKPKKKRQQKLARQGTDFSEMYVASISFTRETHEIAIIIYIYIYYGNGRSTWILWGFSLVNLFLRLSYHHHGHHNH